MRVWPLDIALSLQWGYWVQWDCVQSIKRQRFVLMLNEYNASYLHYQRQELSKKIISFSTLLNYLSKQAVMPWMRELIEAVIFTAFVWRFWAKASVHDSLFPHLPEGTPELTVLNDSCCMFEYNWASTLPRQHTSAHQFSLFQWISSALAHHSKHRMSCCPHAFYVMEKGLTATTHMDFVLPHEHSRDR